MNKTIIDNQLILVTKVVNTINGTVEKSIEYDSFGNILSDSNPNFQPFTLAGGIYDNDTKLIRFGARDYDAREGRWTSKDPIKFDGGRNFYVYCGGNPVNKVDVNGLESQTDATVIIANWVFSVFVAPSFGYPIKNELFAGIIKWGLPIGSKLTISSGWGWIIGDFILGYGGVLLDVLNGESFWDSMGNYRGGLGILGRQYGPSFIEHQITCSNAWWDYFFGDSIGFDINDINLDYGEYVEQMKDLERLKLQNSEKNYNDYPIIKSPYDNH